MADCITMVGYVCSGKTTALKSIAALSEIEVLNTDNYIFSLVDSGEYTDYPEAFAAKRNVANKMFASRLNEIAELGSDVIIDRINLNINSRNRLFSVLPDHEHICINIRTDFNITLQRYNDLEAYYKQPDQPNYYRDIPRHLLSIMANDLEVPSLKEGYKCIINIDENGKFLFMTGEETKLAHQILMQLD
ncbi:AAA family ATPase [Vibrio coralliirubri]|uniref:AAA family ATPase n=1 Tax=Vibrio coralliirubri TaxID=1516159 RepID=UPI00228461F7|nr:AAA family ATPase [Vibrio coralliirubri]MCY9864959.1 AAA family ATPase [Vibrio coralliirubri]